MLTLSVLDQTLDWEIPLKLLFHTQVCHTLGVLRFATMENMLMCAMTLRKHSILLTDHAKILFQVLVSYFSTRNFFVWVNIYLPTYAKEEGC